MPPFRSLLELIQVILVAEILSAVEIHPGFPCLTWSQGFFNLFYVLSEMRQVRKRGELVKR